jgi:phosphoribosylaminoimidazolecarboxamide formyltransferase/IMP cyclohydrolase
MRRALLSVTDKQGLVEFANGLVQTGFSLLSTGGTARVLAEAGVQAQEVAAYTGFPEMMDGRVKTLHPKVHGGLLARRDDAGDRAAMESHGIDAIDLLCVNLYHFRETVKRPGISRAEIIEHIDIGGPAMIRSAAKNHASVAVVVDPSDYGAVLRALREHNGKLSPELLRKLAAKAFAHTAAYDAAIAQWFDCERRTLAGEPFFAPRVSFWGEKLFDLRYGENPHQQAYWQVIPESMGRTWQVHQGKELSYTNLLDLDAAVRIALEFTEPAGVVIKHTNPCGVATGSSPADAYVRAREADPLSAFGGIVAVNRPLDRETATALTATFIEAVIAPAVSDDAREILAKKANMRVVTADFKALLEPMPFGDFEGRSFLGGMLHQQRDRVNEARNPWPDGDQPKVVTKRAPTEAEWMALRFAWRVCAHVKSNAVIFTSADRTLAVGAGQMSRVDAVKVATLKAGEGALRQSVAASDAFFPFRDGLDALATAGATAVVQPGGSMRDAEVIAAADEHGLAMVFTGRRHFRH